MHWAGHPVSFYLRVSFLAEKPISHLLPMILPSCADKDRSLSFGLSAPSADAALIVLEWRHCE